MRVLYLLLATLIFTFSCGGGGGGGSEEPNPNPEPTEPQPQPEPQPEPQPSFEDLLKKKLEDPVKRRQLEYISDMLKDLENLDRMTDLKVWGIWGLEPDGWYVAFQWNFGGAFEDTTGTIKESDLTFFFVSPDDDGNKLHLISVNSNSTEPSKYLYSDSAQKNEADKTFTWDNLQLYDNGNWKSLQGTITALAIDSSSLSAVVEFPDGTYGWTARKDDRLRAIFVAPSWKIIYVRDFSTTYSSKDRYLVRLEKGEVKGSELCFDAYVYDPAKDSYYKRAVWCF